MGWNDRLPEDPYWPFQNEEDRQTYEDWQLYLESQLTEAEINSDLNSQTLRPEDISRLTALMDHAQQDNKDSRQPAHHQTQQTDRRTHSPADSQDVQREQEVP